MSIAVRPAETGDIDAVCELLHENMSGKISKERWRNLLDYAWRPVDAGRGMVALDGRRLVGFLGLVYADRPIDGRTERFCNICAWYLLKDYRGRGIGRKIQLASIADPNVTYTILTATAATGRAFAAYGFQVLDAARYIARRGGAAADLEYINDRNAIEPLLDPISRNIFEAHRSFNLRHVLARAGGRSCYLVMQVKRKGDDVSYHEVLYLSDAAFFAEHVQGLANGLLDHGNSVLAIDKRFLAGSMPWETETLGLPRWYRSHLGPAKIDHLYSEIPLLDLKL
jgi:GNAT superfamily N-acetyltransferase